MSERATFWRWRGHAAITGWQALEAHSGWNSLWKSPDDFVVWLRNEYPGGDRIEVAEFERVQPKVGESWRSRALRAEDKLRRNGIQVPPKSRTPIPACSCKATPSDPLRVYDPNCPVPGHGKPDQEGEREPSQDEIGARIPSAYPADPHNRSVARAEILAEREANHD